MPFTSTVFMLICAFGAMNVAPKPHISIEALLSDNLVEAKVLKAVPQGGTYRTTSDVTHVYKGDPKLLGKTFDVTLLTSGESLGGLPAFLPPLTQRDTVIWLLHWDRGALTYVPFGPSMRKSAYGGVIGLPARQGEKYEPNAHEEVLQWARAVEETAKADPVARYSLLTKYAQSNSRPVVVWSLGVLAEADPRGSAAFFRELIARADVKVWQKVITEQTLANLPEAGWRTSPKRLRLYQSWARGPMADLDANEMQRSLALMVQHPDFPMEDFFNLLKAIVGRKEFPAKTRARAVDSFSYFSREPTLRLPAFEFLLALVSPTEQFDVQLAAARNIRHSFPKEAQSRHKAVETTRGSVNDKTVSKLLQEALRSSQTPFDRLDEAFRSHLKEP